MIFGWIKLNAFHKKIIKLIANYFLFKTNFDFLANKKYHYLLTIFVYMEYYLISIIDIILKETKPAFQLKKQLFLKIKSISFHPLL